MLVTFMIGNNLDLAPNLFQKGLMLDRRENKIIDIFKLKFFI